VTNRLNRIWLSPPLAFARVGSGTTPVEAFHWGPGDKFARATRHPEFADVPTARELASNHDAQALIEFAELSYKISRPFAAPPDVPAERAKAQCP
jgi:hypothetical protein